MIRFEDLNTHQIDLAKCSAENAVKLLEKAAGCLERREVMPAPIADFIAKAFRATVRVDHDQRPVTLAAWLKLTALNRRPKYTKEQLSMALTGVAMSVACFGWSETQTKIRISRAWGVSETQALTWWKEWKEKNPKVLESAERHAESWKAENAGK